MAEHSDGPLVAGWGRHSKPDRVADILDLPGMHRLAALALTRGGQPSHPLRLPRTLTPRPWGGRPQRRPRASDEEDDQYAVVIAQPGRPDIRLGPCRSLQQATTISTSLRQQTTSPQYIPGAMVLVHPFIPGLGHVDPHVPRDPHQRAALMGDDPRPGGHRPPLPRPLRTPPGTRGAFNSPPHMDAGLRPPHD